MSISLFVIAKSYYLFKEPGYYRSTYECVKSFSTNMRKKCGNDNCIINKNFDNFKYLNFLLDKLNSTKIEMELIYHEFITIDYYFDLCKKIDTNFKYVYQFLDRIKHRFNFTKKQIKTIMEFKKCLKMKERKIIF